MARKMSWFNCTRRKRCILFRSLCVLVCVNCLIMSIYVKINIGSLREEANDFARFPKEVFHYNEPVTPTPTRCQSKTNVVFLKTHKTGSTTITNILNRFGLKKQLLFALPEPGKFRLGWPWTFHRQYVDPLRGSIRPNILCHHARYNRAAMQELMPKGSFYFTILRNPVTQFESTFSYMMFEKILGMHSNSNDSLTEFFKNPKEILVNYVLTQDLKKLSDRLKLIRNGMSYDLGLDPGEFDNEEKIEKNILKLERELDLVMIMEHFDESLIMLKRSLCWEMDDVVYFHLNSRPDTEKRPNISEDLADSIRNWSNADLKMYNYFYKAFLRKLGTYDSSFYEEVEELRNRSRTLQETCLSSVSGVKEFQGTFLKKLNLRRGLTKNTLEICQIMRKNEMEFMKDLRTSQQNLLDMLYPPTNESSTARESKNV